MKRLYVGGLGHTVSEKDLKDRFGKFGDVSDVDIITRKDENGAPLKTFGYINIDITDANYRRCVGILNKSTWKGGTLLIQLAKESFLHRLAEERQELVEKAKTPKTVPEEQLVDSLKAAGVENFHMKAAVPGTEIPGHKNWVVSKFGRVLPVVNLKCDGKHKVFKYDPSKHCHNIKKLEIGDDVTSVSKLTWEIEGGDDEISKKRRGEFPEQKTCPKRSKIDVSLFLRNLAQRNGINAAATGNTVAIQQNGLKPGKQTSVRVFDNDSDSEEEIRMLVAQEHLRNPKQTSTEDDDGKLEVVGDDFVVKSNVFWGGVEQDDMKMPLFTSSKDDEEYDSADTDEILTQRKTQKVECTPASQDFPTESSKNKSESESDDSDVSVDSDYEAMMGNCYRLDISLADLEQLAKKADVFSDDESVEKAKDEPKTPSAPPKKTANNPEDILASLLGDDTPDKESKKKKKNQVNAVSLPAFIGTKDLFGGPEPSLKRVAQNIDCDSPKRLKQKEQSILEDTSQPQSSNRLSLQTLSNLNRQSVSKKLQNKASSEDDSSSEESESSCKEDAFTSKTSSASQSVRAIPETKLKTVSSNNSNTPVKTSQTKTSRSSSSDSSSEESESSEEEDNKDKAGILTSKTPSATQLARITPKTELKSSINSIKPSQTKSSRSSSSDSSSEETESSEEDDKAGVLTSKTPLVAQNVKTISKTEIHIGNSSKSPVKPSQTQSSRSSSSDSSSEEDDNEGSAGVLTSKTPSQIKTANSSKSPVKPNQTKTSRSSSSDSSSEESESSEEEDNAMVSISKRSSASQSAKTSPETELKTSNSNNSIKPKQKKTSGSSSSESSGEESESSEEEDNAKVPASKTSSAKQSVRAISETKLKTVSSNNSNTSVKPSQTQSSRSSSSDSSSEEDDNEGSAGVLTSKTPSQIKTANSSKSPVKPNQTKTSRSSSSDSSSEESESSEEEDNSEVSTSKTSSAAQLARITPETELKSSNNSIKPSQTKSSRSSSSDSSSEEPETSDDEKSKTKPATSKNDQEHVVSHQTVLHSTVIDAKKQQQDNQKRLAAQEQRQKETEQQRKLIQGALSNMDTTKTNKSKHIVFDSDDDETTSGPKQPPTNLKKSLFEEDSGSDEDQQTLKEKKKQKKNEPGGSKLFDSEAEGDGSEDDRFQIKPQFEGKAGQKLMKLQARFGADSRFQIDSRFIESDDESEDQDEAAPEKDADTQLLEEKKKSLDILQSILNTNLQPQNTRKSKMFKDIVSLQYDPTQEEHAAFEAKKETPKKESKAERRMKRIEAEKLPEVSKDIYFDVSVDLKKVFGTSTENQEEKEVVSWDKETGDTEDIMKYMEVSNAEEKEDASGSFKFSFFGGDTAAKTTTKTDEYKIETLKEAKFSWQADPRFQDSSSDEEEMDEVEENQSASRTITEEPAKSKTFFFFYQNDERLKEGPGMFWRSVKLQDQKEEWEQKRTLLREDCHRKHRNAKRRQRPSLKS